MTEDREDVPRTLFSAWDPKHQNPGDSESLNVASIHRGILFSFSVSFQFRFFSFLISLLELNLWGETSVNKMVQALQWNTIG